MVSTVSQALLSPGFLYHFPCKRFRIPEICGIGLPLVKATEIF